MNTYVPTHRHTPTRHVSRLRWTGGTALVLAAGVAIALAVNLLAPLSV